MGTKLDIYQAPVSGKGCFSCKHLHKGYESWEMPDYWWFECGARPANEYLKGFPWKITKCKLREINDIPSKASDSGP